MSHAIAWFFELLWRLLWSQPDHHPAADSVSSRPDVRRQVQAPVSAPRAERWLQRQRRAALWLAVHGVDVGPRVLHGVKVVVW